MINRQNSQNTTTDLVTNVQAAVAILTTAFIDPKPASIEYPLKKPLILDSG